MSAYKVAEASREKGKLDNKEGEKESRKGVIILMSLCFELMMHPGRVRTRGIKKLQRELLAEIQDSKVSTMKRCALSHSRNTIIP